MGWQATGGSWTGDTPGQDDGLPGQDQGPGLPGQDDGTSGQVPGQPGQGQGPGLPGQDGSTPGEKPAPAGPPGLPAGFEHGGPWAQAAPSAALATALEHAAGPAGLYEDSGTDALVGIARQWAAIESWAAAGKLAALRAMTREVAGGTPRLRRRADLPDGWDDSLTYEISGALAIGPVSAGNLATLAWVLGTRLAGTGRLLAGGTLTLAKAKLIAQLLEPLDDDEAARAEALILGDLPGKTYPQVERLAWRAALAVAPDAATRRRQAAERRARVTVFREESGTVALSGRDLPAAQALAGHASVLARAALYQASGAFDGQAESIVQAQAYVDLLNGVTARDRIAFARTATAGAEPPGPGPGDGHGDSGCPDPSGDGGPGPADRGPGPSGSPRPDGGHGDGGGTGPSGDGCPGPSGSPRPDGGRGDGDDGREADESRAGDRPDETDGPDGPRGPSVPLTEVTVPLATLQHRAERAGESRLLGPLDPALTRDLAAAAARSPRSCWELTIVDQHGYATGHGTARPARPARGASPPPPQLQPQPPPGPALPARVNITITEDFLHQLTAQAAQPRPGAPPGTWALTPGTPGTWILTLPGGSQLTVRFDVVPTHDCDHRYRVSSYLPGDRLRRLVQVRDHQCTWPPCSRPARESDFEHAIPYHKGGITDACNAGARSRRCHQVKQLPGWTLTQPKPGWHVWTTPTSRSYVQEPWRYTALPAEGAGGLGATRSDWAPTPMGPWRSESTEVASPVPPGEIAVWASRQIHSPSASRCRCTVSSGLMAYQWARSTSHEAPFPLSAMASTRSRGLGASSGTSG